MALVIAEHQANLSRLGEAWGQKICDALDASDRELIAHLKDLLNEVKAEYKINTKKSVDQLAYIRSRIEEIRVRAFVRAEKELREEAPTLIDNETKWSKRILSEITGEKASKFADLTPKRIDKVLENGIIQNRPWADWWTYTADADVQRIANVCNAGLVQGITTENIVRLIMGTREGNYEDGMLSTSRASARNLARTICSGIANQAKDEFYRANDDVVLAVEWLDTLDGRTCVHCAGLDRMRWKTDEPHPVPPLHPSCYDKETRVLTDKGLKYFADLDGSEQFFSFNPETEKIELVKAVKYIRCPVQDEELLHFSNDRFDLTVTKNHQMFLRDGNGYRFINAGKVETADKSLQIFGFDYAVPLRETEITPIRYTGDVFCVELERNYTLYVERHGKFCWCGNCRCVLLPVTDITDLGDETRPMANADFMAEAKRMYEAQYQKKKFDDLAYSTKKKWYYKAMKDFEARTGRPAYSQVKWRMSFRDYFLQMSEQQKRDWLGPEKYKLWKTGKYDIKDFIPPYPQKAMTVKQLKELDKASFGK